MEGCPSFSPLREILSAWLPLFVRVQMLFTLAENLTVRAHMLKTLIWMSFVLRCAIAIYTA
jgi:hypothetical protein